MESFPDWRRAPNIAGDPVVYEVENEALARDGRLDRALAEFAPWDGKRLLDIGCGSGFRLPRYAEAARSVIGVEPDPDLLELARQRTEGFENVETRHGSAEHLPVADGSVDVAHARFAYFFGPGAEVGLDEVRRVLAPDGVLLVIDNSWKGGDFAELLRSASTGNAGIDPERVASWWRDRGAVRHEVVGGWAPASLDELRTILRLEFPADVVERFMQHRHEADLSYQFAVYEWRP